MDPKDKQTLHERLKEWLGNAEHLQSCRLYGRTARKFFAGIAQPDSDKCNCGLMELHALLSKPDEEQKPEHGERALGIYRMSKDYEALYELLRKDGSILGWVDHDRLGTGFAERTACLVIGRSGYLCFDYHETWKQVSTKWDFIAECTRLNLEWLAPSPAKAGKVLNSQSDEDEIAAR